jgi:hypothetical protein
VSGKFTIHPPLSNVELRRDPLGAFPDAILMLFAKSRSKTDADGTVWTSQIGTEVRVQHEGRIRAYRLAEEVQAVASAYPDHTFDGWIVRAGEEHGDVERLAIKDGAVVHEAATLTWPDGSQVELGQG